MDRPTPGELKNVDVQLVSLVDQGANRARFKIFKSEDPVETQKTETQTETAPTAQSEAPTEVAVEKSEYQGYSLATAIGIETAEADLWRLFDVVRQVYGNIVGSADLVDKNAAIAQLAEDLKADLLRRTAGLGVAKSERSEDAASEAVEKAGRKIATSRLQALKEAMTLLEQIISEAEPPAGDGEPEEASQGVAKSQELEGLAEAVLKIAGLEKANAELSGAVEAAVTKAVEPVLARLGVLEKARGLSNQIIDERVAKQQPAGTFGGVIFGRR